MSIFSFPHRLESLLTHLPGLCRILDMGCGDGRDLPLLRQLYPEALILALDADWQALLQVPRSVYRLQANLAHLPLVVHFDGILVRHPDVARQPEPWRTFLGTASRFLAPDGRLVLTTYAADEMQVAQRWLDRCLQPLSVPTELAPPDISGRDCFIRLYCLST